MLFIVASACTSRSGKRNQNKIEEVEISKDILAQDGYTISFMLHDTVGYIVTSTEYYATITNVFPINETHVVISVAYPIDKDPKITYLKIQ